MKIKNENSGTEYCQTTLNVDEQKIWTSENYQWKNSTDQFNLKVWGKSLDEKSLDFSVQNINLRSESVKSSKKS